MATRVNTKFIIGLVFVLGLMVVGGVFAVKLAKRSAQDRAREGDEARQSAIDAFASGDREAGNDFAMKAWREYGAAMKKAPNDTGYIYQFIGAHEMFVCEDITDAENRLSVILTASRQAHNVDGATEDDKHQFYDRMMLRFRENLVVGNGASGRWIRVIHDLADQDVNNNANDALALRWLAISSVYLMGDADTPLRRAKPLENLMAALEANPTDARVIVHIARWHVAQALHLKSAQGGEITTDVEEAYAVAETQLIRAFELTADDPVNQYQAIWLYAQLPPNESRNATVTEKVYAFAEQLIASEEDRRALTSPEISYVVGVLNRLATRLVGEDNALEREQVLTRSTTLGDWVVADNPDRPSYYHIQANAHQEAKSFDEAIAALNQGLALDPAASASDFMIGYYARIALKQKLADVYIIAAANAEGGSDRREELLNKAEETIVQLRVFPGADAALQVAYADYLMAKLMWVRGRLDLAIKSADAANRVQQNASIETLILLAKAHSSPNVNNLGPAATYYELAIARNPALLSRLDLVQIYLNMGTHDALGKAQNHILDFLQQDKTQRRAHLLYATVLTRYEQYDRAIEVLEGLNPEDNPQLMVRLASYHARKGDPETAIELLENLLANDPNENNALPLLFSLITEKQDRLERLAQLREAGLDAETADRLQIIIENDGTMPVADIVGTIETNEDFSELDRQKQLFRVYSQNNDIENRSLALANLVDLAPNEPEVLTWRFGQAFLDKDWALAERLIEAMLELPLHVQPRSATAGGRFLRAQLISAQAGPNPDVADQSEAIAIFRDALEVDPSYSQGWSLLGRLLALRHDWIGARDAFQEAYTLQPSNLDAARNYARMLIRTQQAELALSIYRQLFAENPTHAGIQNEYLESEARHGAYIVALNQRLRIQEEHPDDAGNLRALAVLFAREERFDESIAAMNHVAQLEGRTRSNVQALAAIHLMAGNNDQCLQTVQDYIVERGNDCDSADYLLLGPYLLQLGKLEEGESAYQQAIALEDPVLRSASREWAKALSSLSRFPESVRLFNELLEDSPGDHNDLRTRMVRALIAMQSYDRAATELEDVAPSPQRELIRIQIAQLRGNTDAALNIAAQAVIAYPDDPTLQFNHARFLAQSGEITQAIATCEQIIRNVGKAPAVEVFLAELEFSSGRQADGITRVNRLIVDNPNNETARIMLFQFYSTQYNQIRSENVIQRRDIANLAYLAFLPAAEAHSDNAGYLRNIGLAAYRANRLEDSARFYRAALLISREDDTTTTGVNDMTQLTHALLDRNRNREVIGLFNDGENSKLVADSLQLRTLRARAYAQNNQWDVAFNQFRHAINECESPDLDEEAVADLKSQIINIIFGSVNPQDKATRYPEIIAFVEDVFLDKMTTGLDIYLAARQMEIDDYDAIIVRLTAHLEQSAADTVEGAELRQTIAQAYQAQDDVDNARTYFEEALAFHAPGSLGSFAVLNNLAYLLSDQTDDVASHLAAVRYAQRAVEIVNEDDRFTSLTRALIYDTLGWAQFKAREYDDAVATLNHSIELRALVVNQLHLGLAYLAMDDLNKASIALDNADRLLRQEVDSGNMANVQYQERISQGIEQTRNN